MKFITKTLLLTAFFMSPVHAEWIHYANNTDRTMFLYYQNLSIAKKGALITVLIRKNFKITNDIVFEGKTIFYKSTISKQLINCDKNTYATTEVFFYEDWDTSKEELYKTVFNKVKWNSVKDGSVQEGLMDKVCFRV